MAFFCYTSKDGKTIEEEFPMGKAPSMVVRELKVYRRDVAAEHRGRIGCHANNWPQVADDLGVHPHQVEQENRTFAEMGLSKYAGYLPNGQIKYKSPRSKKIVCETLRYYDRNGGYSDPQRR